MDGIGDKERMRHEHHATLDSNISHTHHGAAVGVGVEVAAEGDNHSGFQHVSGARLGQPEHTHSIRQLTVISCVCVLVCVNTVGCKL